MKINPLNVLKGLGAFFVVAVSLVIAVGTFYNNDQLTGSLTGNQNGEDYITPTFTLIAEAEPFTRSTSYYTFDYTFYKYNRNSPSGRILYIVDNDRDYPYYFPFKKKLASNVYFSITEDKARSSEEELKKFDISYDCIVSSNKTRTAKRINGTGPTISFTPQNYENYVCTFINVKKE